MEPIITIRPQPFSRIAGRNFWVSSTCPMTLTWNSRSSASRGSSSSGPFWLSPALFTRTLGEPSARTSSAKVSIEVGSARSRVTYFTFGRGSVSVAGFRVVPTTRKPEAAKRAATALPIPLLAPVTTARLPSGTWGRAGGRNQELREFAEVFLGTKGTLPLKK